ncbi:hypothetical protein [Methylocystis iwaonis]|uniref:hypothetical protein n=1 Tax=Methylocystis iwaonis TaxID=2885079 RepID=UPI002E7C52A2|nr:hypothetical protein [Methylocystis iwaonis]
MSVLERANRTPVSPNLLGDAMEAIAGMSPENRSIFEARTLRLIQLLANKGLTERRRADLVMALSFRLEALAHLVDGDHVKGWTLPGQADGATYLHADILKAAVKEPLIESAEGSPTFDAPAFGRRVLEIAKAKGRA